MLLAPSMNVLENRPETSGLNSALPSAWSTDSSYMPLAATVACRPGFSSGRVVLTLIVEPIPPVGTSARPVLKTSTADTPSAARLLKSKSRLRPLVVGICRPFSSTRLNCGPKPRTVTRAPSPRSRSMDTPVMRCSDSARFVSGKLPMSSAVIASTTPSAPRFRSMEARRLPRIPVTTTSSITWSSCASAGCMAGAPTASAMPLASGVFVNVGIRMFKPPPSLQIQEVSPR